MESATPRVRKDTKRASKQIQVAIRQRAPSKLHSSFVCTPDSISLNGTPFYFDRVFGPREKNQKVLDFISPAIVGFRNGGNACIIGFGHKGSGVSWTLGTNPTSNGLIPSIYRYLKEEKVKFQIKVEWISPSPKHTHSLVPGPEIDSSYKTHEKPAIHGLRDSGDRQDLKDLLSKAVPPAGTHLIVWFILTRSPSAKLALADLCEFPPELIPHLQYNTDEDNLLVSYSDGRLLNTLDEVIGPKSAINLIGCVSDSQENKFSMDTISNSLKASGDQVPIWLHSPLGQGLFTPSEGSSEESQLFGGNEPIESPEFISSGNIIQKDGSPSHTGSSSSAPSWGSVNFDPQSILKSNYSTSDAESIDKSGRLNSVIPSNGSPIHKDADRDCTVANHQQAEHSSHSNKDSSIPAASISPLHYLTSIKHLRQETIYIYEEEDQ